MIKENESLSDYYARSLGHLSDSTRKSLREYFAKNSAIPERSVSGGQVFDSIEKFMPLKNASFTWRVSEKFVFVKAAVFAGYDLDEVCKKVVSVPDQVWSDMVNLYGAYCINIKQLQYSYILSMTSLDDFFFLISEQKRLSELREIELSDWMSVIEVWKNDRNSPVEWVIEVL